MPLPAVWDPKYGPGHLKQVCLSDGESDTTAKTSAGALSVSSAGESNYAQQPAVASTPKETPYPDECVDYIQGKCENGDSCALKHFGYDAKGNKKQVCLGFVKGRCTYGLKCKFLHHAFDPVTQTWREACVQHANYKCTRGDECPLLHVASRKKNKTDPPRSRGTVPPPRQEAKYPAKQASLTTTWGPPPHESRTGRVLNRAAIQRELLETRAEILLIRLDYEVGIDGMLGMLSWCGLDPHMYDLVLPPPKAYEHGVIRFTAPEYAASFVEACDLPGSVTSPAVQNVAVLLGEFAARLPPNHDPYLLLIRDNGRKFLHVKVFELLEMLRREPISTSSYPEQEHGRVISEPLLKDCLNRPRFDAYEGPTEPSGGGIRLEAFQPSRLTHR